MSLHYTIPISKRDLSAQLEAEYQAFLAAGRVPQQIPEGVSAYDVPPRPLTRHQAQQRERRKRQYPPGPRSA